MSQGFRLASHKGLSGGIASKRYHICVLLLACKVYKLDLVSVPCDGQVLSNGSLQNKLMGDKGAGYKPGYHLLDDVGLEYLCFVVTPSFS